MAAKNYTEMREGLALNLQAHEGLLQVLGKAYSGARRHRLPGLRHERNPWIADRGTARTEEAGTKDNRHFLSLRSGTDHSCRGRGVPVGLCAGAECATELVERVLPRNTCALIKSFVGFKLPGVCPYVEACDLVIGETTCDGKTKAYEVFSEYKPRFYPES
jgi:hypothetical protein